MTPAIVAYFSNGFMADLEYSHTPTWAATIEGQIDLLVTPIL